MSELVTSNEQRMISRRAAMFGLVAFGLSLYVSGCGGSGSSPETAPAQPDAPAPNPENQGHAWDIDCTASVQVESGDVFADVIDRADDQCPNLSIHDAYESMGLQGRSVNEIYAGETIVLNDYKNVP